MGQAHLTVSRNCWRPASVSSCLTSTASGRRTPAAMQVSRKRRRAGTRSPGRPPTCSACSWARVRSCTRSSWKGVPARRRGRSAGSEVKGGGGTGVLASLAAQGRQGRQGRLAPGTSRAPPACGRTRLLLQGADRLCVGPGAGEGAAQQGVVEHHQLQGGGQQERRGRSVLRVAMWRRGGCPAAPAWPMACAAGPSCLTAPSAVSCTSNSR